MAGDLLPEPPALPRNLSVFGGIARLALEAATIVVGWDGLGPVPGQCLQTCACGAWWAACALDRPTLHRHVQRGRETETPEN